MAEQRWLTADEQDTWRALVAVMIQLPAALDRQLRRDQGFSHFEYQVLAALSEASDRSLRIGVLAGLTEGSLPRVSQVVTRLEERGWLARSVDPNDGRFTRATLTDAGWEAIVSAAPAHVDTVRRLVVDPLSATQLRQLRTIADRISAAIEDDDHP